MKVLGKFFFVLLIAGTCIYFYQTQKISEAPPHYETELAVVQLEEQINTPKNTIDQIQSKQPAQDPAANTASTPCISSEQMEELNQSWFDQIKSFYDEDGNLLPEYDYLSQLNSQQITDFAEQGYDSAMVVLGERLLENNRAEDITQGRQWLYQAVVNGVVSAIGPLMVSHLHEYQSLKQSENVNDKKKALRALREFKAHLNLMEHIAPGSTEPEQDMIGSLDMDITEQQANQQRNNELIQDFQEQRKKLGLGPLKIEFDSITDHKGAVPCSDDSDN